ncbi:hypothetical protein CSE45_5147 [Citreicella sp. SE45]|nr:hypothetical protein CSE45_5147 [Citreicella sp. SE45]
MGPSIPKGAGKNHRASAPCRAVKAGRNALLRASGGQQKTAVARRPGRGPHDCRFTLRACRFPACASRAIPVQIIAADR